MPTLQSDYKPPLWFRNGHISTMYAGLLRNVTELVQHRERMTLPDGDFLDLDWSYAKKPAHKLVVVVHGLEGNAQRPYIKGAAKMFVQAGYDVCALNLRGCSGEPNLKFRSYHSGATEDLIAVLDHILQQDHYGNIYLKGFSLGGNLILKFLGEGHALPKQLKAAVAVSVPCQLASSLEQLLSPKNMLYAARFKKNLLEKLRAKQRLFPALVTDSDIAKIHNLKDFDDIYTSRAHGFKDAMDYYAQCSSLQYLPRIAVPSLIVNARNDSFLGPACYPVEEAKGNARIFLEMPCHGGHVGFQDKNNTSYTEKRAVTFFATHS